LQANGGTAPYTWRISKGSLPSGLALLPSNGTISGMPTASATSAFTATVTDSSSPAQAASASTSIPVVGTSAVTPIPLTITSVLPSVTVGTAYIQTLQASGGTTPYTWSITSGNLPAGLSLSALTGVVSGTPTVSGSYAFTIAVGDSSSPVLTQSAPETIVVTANQLTITSSTLLSGTSGTAYAQVLTASGGTPAYTWSITSGGLPAGLTLAATTGVVSGTPTSTGTSNFAVTVSDNGKPVQTQSVASSITVIATQQITGPGTTWYVRTDGGTRYSSNVTTGQCDGQADAAYPGSGANQHCAFSDVRYMWTDGTYGISAWVIAGGDTVVIRGCAANTGQQNPDAPHCRIGWDTANGGGMCQGVNAFWGCSVPPPPSGTSAQHTRILGGCAYGTYTCNPVIGYPYTSNNLTQLFGGFDVGAVMYLSGSQYVDLEGLEITSHNGQCSRYGAPEYPSGCSTNAPVGDFANWGIVTTNKTSNITLQDIYIHGLTTIGIGGPIGGPFTLTRVSIDFNTFAGWNFDDGVPTPDAPGSSITQSYVTMIGNGCLEEYPIVHTQFPAKSCWDTQSGGFGDSWSGQAGPASEESDMDSFTCDHCYVAYNTKDGALGPHTLLKKLSLTNSVWIGNMGQQGKWGMQQNSTTALTNNLIVGNCYRMSEQLPGAAQNFNISSGLGGSYLSGFCRASGTVFDYFADLNSTVLFANNTFVTYSPTIFDFGCGTLSGGCNPYALENNIFLGYTSGYTFSPFDAGYRPGAYVFEANSSVIASNNIEFGVRDGDACTGSILCVDPLLVNEPASGTIPPESTLDNFNFHLAVNSPAIGAGTAISGLTTDYYGVARPTPPAIGAVEP
jgi:hypothetical protein